MVFFASAGGGVAAQVLGALTTVSPADWILLVLVGIPAWTIAVLTIFAWLRSVERRREVRQLGSHRDGLAPVPAEPRER